MNIYVCNKPLIFQTGSNIKLTDRAEYFKSIIADGKELIKTGEEEWGTLLCPNSKTPRSTSPLKRVLQNFCLFSMVAKLWFLFRKISL